MKKITIASLFFLISIGAQALEFNCYLMDLSNGEIYEEFQINNEASYFSYPAQRTMLAATVQDTPRIWLSELDERWRPIRVIAETQLQLGERIMELEYEPLDLKAVCTLQ